MKILSKLIRNIITLGVILPSTVVAHPGHGKTEPNYYHYLIDHLGNHYFLLFFLALLLVVLRVSVKK